jgi:hypothetical protein
VCGRGVAAAAACWRLPAQSACHARRGVVRLTRPACCLPPSPRAADSDDGADEDDEEGDDELADDEADDDEQAAPPRKMKKIKRDDWEKLNDNKAIWLRKPSEVTKEEYEKFYTAISKVRAAPPPPPPAARRASLGDSRLAHALPAVEHTLPCLAALPDRAAACPRSGLRRRHVLEPLQGGGRRGVPLRPVHPHLRAVQLLRQVLREPGARRAPAASGQQRGRLGPRLSVSPPASRLAPQVRGLKLYVRRVFISDDFTELIPR